jgi:hypothetical protein
MVINMELFGIFGKKKVKIKDVKLSIAVSSDEELRAQAEEYYRARKAEDMNKPKPKKVSEMTAQERDKTWQNYVNESIKHIQEHYYGLYRNCRYTMAEFVKKEGKYRTSLALFAEVLFWDLTGCKTPDEIKMLFELKMFHIAPYERTSLIIAPRVIKEIATCQKKLNLTDGQLRDAILEDMYQMTAPVQFFTREECTDIFFFKRDGDEEALKKVFNKAEKQFDLSRPNKPE